MRISYFKKNKIDSLVYINTRIQRYTQENIFQMKGILFIQSADRNFGAGHHSPKKVANLYAKFSFGDTCDNLKSQLLFANYKCNSRDF